MVSPTATTVSAARTPVWESHQYRMHEHEDAAAQHQADAKAQHSAAKPKQAPERVPALF